MDTVPVVSPSFGRGITCGVLLALPFWLAPVALRFLTDFGWLASIGIGAGSWFVLVWIGIALQLARSSRSG